MKVDNILCIRPYDVLAPPKDTNVKSLCHVGGVRDQEEGKDVVSPQQEFERIGSVA